MIARWRKITFQTRENRITVMSWNCFPFNTFVEKKHVIEYEKIILKKLINRNLSSLLSWGSLLWQRIENQSDFLFTAEPYFEGHIYCYRGHIASTACFECRARLMTGDDAIGCNSKEPPRFGDQSRLNTLCQPATWPRCSLIRTT